MRRGHGSRFTPFQVGLIALIVIVIGTYLGASKDIPFTRPYQLKAVFENAPPIHTGQAVRIAGVDVGKVSAVEAVGGDSPAVVVTMKLKDEALPIHKDAQIKVRPRLFFEGNLFFDIRPGTPQAGTVDDGGTIPVSQTSAPVQLDQVLGTLTEQYARGPPEAPDRVRQRAQRRAAARRGRRPGPGHEGRDRRKGAERLARVLGGLPSAAAPS